MAGGTGQADGDFSEAKEERQHPGTWGVVSFAAGAEGMCEGTLGRFGARTDQSLCGENGRGKDRGDTQGRGCAQGPAQAG